MAHSTNGHHAAAGVLLQPQQVTRETLGRLFSPGAKLQGATWLFAALFALGIVGFVMRLGSGFGDRTAWGYYAATFASVLTTVQAAPIVAVALRLVKGDWRRPAVRIAELFSFCGVLSVLLYLPLLALIPPLEGRNNLWSGWPAAPQIYDTLAVLFLAIAGLVLLWVSAIPDFATARDAAPVSRQGFYARLAMGWEGTSQGWFFLRRALGVAGAFYLMFYVFTHLVIATDFSMSLVPGWSDAIYPAFHALEGLQTGVASTILAMAIFRSWGGMKEYLRVDQFWGLAKVMLALTLLWFYFWWSGFIIYWYGRTPREQSILELLMFGPYFVPFALAFFFSFVVPFLLLMWNPVRRSVAGPTLAAIVILFGSFFDRIRLYVSAFSIEDLKLHELEGIPPTHFPDVADALIVIGAFGGVVLLYLLGTRLVPVVSIWEMKEGLLLRVVKPFLHGQVVVIGKPE